MDAAALVARVIMLADTVGTTLSPVSATPEALKITKDEPVDELHGCVEIVPTIGEIMFG